jgi:hypothetical protein
MHNQSKTCGLSADLLCRLLPDFATVSQKTVYNYVLSVRSLYDLPLEESGRDFQMTAELPMDSRLR